MRFPHDSKYAIFRENFTDILWAAISCLKLHPARPKGKIRLQLLLIRRQNHRTLPELYLREQQKCSESAREKNVFFSFHHPFKTKKQELFLSGKQATKLRTFTAVRKPPDHIQPTFALVRCGASPGSLLNCMAKGVWCLNHH